ncbi:aminoacyl-tRNA hydrolase [Candidatus Saccharibacteria bacterium]|nr:MAG: aminoacyl-tRNA hydrolase [Candidatus Saccharibacteria bacterium]
MKCIIGLGNPELHYRQTRHNVGFELLDAFATTHGATWQRRDKFRADIAELNIAEERVILVKPTTYYNRVGESAQAIVDFYKITTNDVVVAHDDLALPLGTIRTRQGGSDGGNNGLKSLSQHLGANTNRIRIGVWTDHHTAMDKADVVLGKFTADEQQVITKIKPTAISLLQDFIAGHFESTTHYSNN